ncbi:uncharacterized protein LOC143264759 [Megachile rotundata]|uniref:uncharacterized protein LOC143264759 n=1 Tax=Megachile rotundata TaxID=143995 RepID=UPI003FD2EFFB
MIILAMRKRNGLHLKVEGEREGAKLFTNALLQSRSSLRGGGAQTMEYLNLRKRRRSDYCKFATACKMQPMSEMLEVSPSTPCYRSGVKYKPVEEFESSKTSNSAR